MPVGADVLDRSPANVARNPRQALQAGISAIYCIEDNVVPVLACTGGDQNSVTLAALTCSYGHTDPHDNPVESFVADQKIASAAKNEKRKIAFTGELRCLRDLSLGAGFNEETRRPTDLKRRIGGKEDRLFPANRGRRHGLRVQHRLNGKESPLGTGREGLTQLIDLIQRLGWFAG